VHYCVYALKCCPKTRFVGDVAFDKFEGFDELRESGGKIVLEQNLIAGTAQSARRVTADVACSASYQDRHGGILNALGWIIG